MSKLKILREKRSLTQEELSEKSGLSVRTIQRIESGNAPKGQTLKLLASSLGVEETEFLEKGSKSFIFDTTLLKFINLSSLPFLVIPLANILIPLFIMFAKKQFYSLPRKIVTIQILWTICSIALFCIIAIFVDGVLVGSQLDLALVYMVPCILLNIFIILRNSVELHNHQRLHYSPEFSLI